MVLAVLETRCGVAIGGNDVYLNVAGGLRVVEPAADLAVAAALLSSLSGTPLSGRTVVFGEIGLSGEVRPVGQTDHRLREAAKLGFEEAVVPMQRRPRDLRTADGAGAARTESDAGAATGLDDRPGLRDKSMRDNGARDKGVRGIALRDVARLDEMLPMFGDVPMRV